MDTVTFKGTEVGLIGDFPKVGEALPNFKLIKADLSEMTRDDLKGKKVVLNIFPSIDTGICALQMNKFTQQLKDRPDLQLVFASLDLPFALNRFCAAEGIDNAITTSDFRYNSLASHGLQMTGGPLSGLYARAVLITDENLNIIYAELVPEIVDEPDYAAAMKHL